MVLQKSAKRRHNPLLLSTPVPSRNVSEETASGSENSEPSDNNAHYFKSAGSTNAPSAALATSSIHQRQTLSIHRRQNEGGSTDADNNVPRLATWVRYADLQKANLVRSWTQLLRMIDTEGFPAGKMLSPNIRAWRLDEVEAWLADRPTARKVPPPARPREHYK